MSHCSVPLSPQKPDYVCGRTGVLESMVTFRYDQQQTKGDWGAMVKRPSHPHVDEIVVLNDVVSCGDVS